MQQSKLWSLIEALTNAAIGMVVGLVSQLVVFPATGVRATLGQNLVILAAFTGISVARNYLVRRVFNGPIHRFVLWIARRIEQWLK